MAGGVFQLGRYSSPFGRANLLDVHRPYHYPVPRLIKKLRLKEWQAFQFGDEEWFCFSALYNAKFFSLVMFNAYDRKNRKRYNFQRILPGAVFRFGEKFAHSHQAYISPHHALGFTIDARKGNILLEFQQAGGRRRDSVSGRFIFSCAEEEVAPNVVLLPLGLNRAMYSTKILMPLRGNLCVNGATHDFEPPSAMGIIDDHKGYYPYRMRYDWVTGFGLDSKGRRVGFNVTDNQVRDQAKYNENCVWVGNRVWPLPPVKVSRAEGPSGTWVIQDMEGFVDLSFSPETHNDVRFNLGLIEGDYHGPFGSFKGFVKTGEGEKIEAERLFGAGEQKYLQA